MTQYDTQQLASAIASGLMIWLFIALIFVVLYIIALYKILDKAGYSGWLALLTIIPFVGGIIGFVLILWIAFSDWPVLQELRGLRSRIGAPYGGPPAYTPPAGTGYAPQVAPPATPPVYAPPPAPPAYEPTPPPPTYQPPVAPPPTYEPTPPPTYEPPAPTYEPPAPPPAPPIAPQFEPTPPPTPPAEEPPAGS